MSLVTRLDRCPLVTPHIQQASRLAGTLPAWPRGRATEEATQLQFFTGAALLSWCAAPAACWCGQGMLPH